MVFLAVVLQFQAIGFELTRTYPHSAPTYQVWAKCVKLLEQLSNSVRLDMCIYPRGFVLHTQHLPCPTPVPPLPRTCTQKVPDMSPDVLRQAMALGPVGKAELTHQASVYIG